MSPDEEARGQGRQGELSEAGGAEAAGEAEGAGEAGEAGGAEAGGEAEGAGEERGFREASMVSSAFD